jgi:hypothetical protein
MRMIKKATNRPSATSSFGNRRWAYEKKDSKRRLLVGRRHKHREHPARVLDDLMQVEFLNWNVIHANFPRTDAKLVLRKASSVPACPTRRRWPGMLPQGPNPGACAVFVPFQQQTSGAPQDLVGDVGSIPRWFVSVAAIDSALHPRSARNELRHRDVHWFTVLQVALRYARYVGSRATLCVICSPDVDTRQPNGLRRGR